MSQQEEDLTFKMLNHNAMVFDAIFGAITKPVLPVGDGTCSDQEEVEDDLEWRGGKFV